MLEEIRNANPELSSEQVWKLIYPKAIQGFEQMPRRLQIAAKLRLRDAVRSRRNTRRRRAEKSSRRIVPPGTNPK
jgi:hypothetical protein